MKKRRSMDMNESASSVREFKLPDLGEGMQEAEIVEWLVKAGDTLKLDQTMVKVETDKAIVEIPSPVAGRVSEIRVQGGQVAKVGEVPVVFEAAANGDTPTPGKSVGTSPARSATTLSAVQSTSASPQSTAGRPRVLAAPA